MIALATFRAGTWSTASVGCLFAAPFDPSGLALTGAPTRTVEGVARNGNVGALFDVSRNGSLVYIPGPVTLSSAPPISDLVVTNASGEVEVLKLTPGAFQTPRISPDGKRVAYVASEGQANIWVYDLDARTAPRRLTFGGNNRHPIWSADGRYIVFQSDREGDLGIFRQLADVTGTAVERLTKPAMGTAHIPESWSRKDDLFLFSAVDGSAATLWSYSMRDKTPAQVGNIRSSSALNAELSPDGRWIAYTLRGGEVTTAINLEPFPPTGERRQVSSPTDLGHHAMWSPDGGDALLHPRRTAAGRCQRDATANAGRGRAAGLARQVAQQHCVRRPEELRHLPGRHAFHRSSSSERAGVTHRTTSAAGGSGGELAGGVPRPLSRQEHPIFSAASLGTSALSLHSAPEHVQSRK